MTDLSSKTKRKRLAARAAPHYCRLAKGVSLGWRFRGSHPAKWVVKLTTPDGKYLNRTIGDAEDGGWPGGLTYDAAADEARKIAGAPRLASKITVGDAIDAWRDDRSAGASTSIAKAKIRSEAKLLKEGLGHLRLVDLTAKDLEKWRAGLLRAAEDKRAGKATINRKIAGLKAALNKAATGQQGPHPWDGLEKFKKAESFGARIRVLTRDEEAALLLACPPDLLRFVTFLLRTGARPGEAAAVEIQNILLSEDDNGGWITTTGKVGERTFRLDPA
uniref:hypothetical protein n=1 Tax=Aliiruegeria sabulilitoris TaxID=1510458 RepID=UPI0012E3DAE4